MKEKFFAIKINKMFFSGDYKKFVPSIQMAKWYNNKNDLMQDTEKFDQDFTIVEIFCQESSVLTRKNKI